MTGRKLLLGVLLYHLTIGSVAWGLGLGKITVHSGQNESLKADIALFAINPDEISGVRARLASRQEFEWVGIPRKASLSELLFTPMIDAAGRPIVRVTTERTPTEDFLDFLVEVSWPQGRLIREYTIDRERLTPAAEPPEIPSSTVISVSPDTHDLQQRVEPISKPAPTTSEPKPLRTVPRRPAPLVAPAVTPSDSELPGEYVTRRGDSLYKVSRLYARAAGVRQYEMALALFHLNPEGFIGGDMNRLKAGATLRVPEPAEVSGLAAEAARMRQAELQPQPTPRTVAPSPEPISEQEAQPALAQEDVTETEPETSTTPAPETVASQPEASEAELQPLAGEPEDTAERHPADSEEEVQADKEPASLEILAKDEELVPQESGIDTGAREQIAQLEKTVQLAQELAESRRQENAALTARLNSLNEIVAQQERLIQLQNSQMEELRRKVEETADRVATRKDDFWNIAIIVLAIISAISLILVARLTVLIGKRQPNERTPAIEDTEPVAEHTAVPLPFRPRRDGSR